MNTRYSRLSPKNKKIWDSWNDGATPEERRWLDKLEKIRPWQGPYKATHKPGEKMTHVVIILRTLGHGPWGSMPCTVEWIKKEIQRHRREAAKEHRRKTEELIGAFI